MHPSQKQLIFTEIIADSAIKAMLAIFMVKIVVVVETPAQIDILMDLRMFTNILYDWCAEGKSRQVIFDTWLKSLNDSINLLIWFINVR